MTDSEVADRLKDWCDELGAVGLRATFEVRPLLEWHSVEVRHASAWSESDSPDGWDVETKEMAL